MLRGVEGVCRGKEVGWETHRILLVPWLVVTHRMNPSVLSRKSQLCPAAGRLLGAERLCVNR